MKLQSCKESWLLTLEAQCTECIINQICPGYWSKTLRTFYCFGRWTSCLPFTTFTSCYLRTIFFNFQFSGVNSYNKEFAFLTILNRKYIAVTQKNVNIHQKIYHPILTELFIFSVESWHRRADPKTLSCLKLRVVSTVWLERGWK
jgi:hypothetical protein